MKKHMQMVLAVIVVLLQAISAEAATYSGGSGTETDPYRIGNAADWVTLSNTPGDWDKHFILIADIDFNGASLTPIGTVDGNMSFDGTFDGRGHVVRRARIEPSEKDGVGLFGVLVGPILNLGVEMITVAGNNTRVGSLAGINLGGVISCYATGTVTGNTDVGGLVGENDSLIESCYASCTVTGNDHVGGLVGSGMAYDIKSCYATGVVSGNNHVGGLMGGSNYYGRITSCYATGAVTGVGNDTYYLGGLVGQNVFHIKNCYATGAVTGSKNSLCVGGLVGANSGAITSCYATGAAMGGENSSNVGGLLGYSDWGTVTSCYAIGAVAGGNSVGGLVGLCNSSSPNFLSCYWDKQTTGQNVSNGGEGRTTDEMTEPHALNTYMGWDFADVWVEDADHSINKGYPYLRENRPPSEGTVATPQFSPGPGTYPTAQNVTITCATADSIIRYTLDGSTPAPGSTQYTGPVNITSTKTLNAKAWKAGWIASAVRNGQYTISTTVATPQFTPGPGTYTTAQKVTITCATSLATVRYTLDGSTPTESSAPYTGPVNINAPTTLKAKAWKTGLTASEAQSGDYIITGTVATPKFTPVPGVYTTARNVTITCATADAAIRYTLDGNTPTESSTPYTSPVHIASTTTLKARAWKTDWITSEIRSGTYTITEIEGENESEGEGEGEGESEGTPGTLRFKLAAYPVEEHAGSLRIYVNREGGSDGMATVSYATANGTAKAGQDYTAQFGKLCWSDGDAQDKYVEVLIINDTIAEENETFRVSLTASSGASIGNPSTFTVTILANDSAAEGELEEGEGENNVVEGEGEPIEGEFAEGEPAEGEGEGEPESPGCCEATGKRLTPKELLEHTLGDWLVICISLIALATLTVAERK